MRAPITLLLIAIAATTVADDPRVVRSSFQPGEAEDDVPDPAPAQPPVPFPNEALLEASAPLPPSRSRRLSRAPDMFGDFFGGGGTSISGLVTGNGVTNGTTGSVTFQQVRIVVADPTVVLQHPNGVGTMIVDVPGLVTVNTNNVNNVLVDTGTNFLPPPTVVFTSDAATLGAVTTAINVNAVTTPLVAAILQAELAADPTASLAQVTFTAQNPGQFVNVGSTFDIVFATLVQTLVNTPVQLRIPNPSTGGAVVGRQKIGENNSPFPRDRVFVDYSYFDNVPLVDDGIGINRFVPGFEKTFFDQNASIRVRMPLAATLDNNVNLDGTTDRNEGEIGNLFLEYKQLLAVGDRYAIAAGCGLSLPTADDLSVQFLGREFLRAENRGVHVLPYVAGIASLGDRWFTHGFLQLDFDTNGNPILIDGTGNGLATAGRAQDPTYFFADVGVGCWILDRPNATGLLRGLVGTTELHYNRALQDGDVITLGNLQVGDFSHDFELINALVGATAFVGDSSTLGVAFVTPIGSGSDQQYDGELRVMFNHYFGPGRGVPRPR